MYNSSLTGLLRVCFPVSIPHPSPSPSTQDMNMLGIPKTKKNAFSFSKSLSLGYFVLNVNINEFRFLNNSCWLWFCAAGDKADSLLRRFIGLLPLYFPPSLLLYRLFFITSPPPSSWAQCDHNNFMQTMAYSQQLHVLCPCSSKNKTKHLAS